MPTVQLAISKVRRDGQTQVRDAIDQAVAEEYAEALRDGRELPPIVVYHDGNHYWLADGFHRTLAHELAGRKTILADVRRGTLRDALLYAAGANILHGLRRSNATKRRAVETLLADDEWRAWPNVRIAEHCGVSQALVRVLRAELSSRGARMPDQVQVRRGEQSYTLRPFRERTAAEQAQAVQQAEQQAVQRSCPTCGQPLPPGGRGPDRAA